eukprot:g20468.t1
MAGRARGPREDMRQNIVRYTEDEARLLISVAKERLEELEALRLGFQPPHLLPNNQLKTSSRRAVSTYGALSLEDAARIISSAGQLRYTMVNESWTDEVQWEEAMMLLNDPLSDGFPCNADEFGGYQNQLGEVLREDKEKRKAAMKSMKAAVEESASPARGGKMKAMKRGRNSPSNDEEVPPAANKKMANKRGGKR